MSHKYRNYRAHLYATRRANSKYRRPTRGIISFYQLLELLAVVVGIPVMLVALAGVIAILKGRLYPRLHSWILTLHSSKVKLLVTGKVFSCARSFCFLAEESSARK